MSEGTWTKVASRAEVVEGVPTGAKVGDKHITLYNLNGEIFATSGLCTHSYALMSHGYIDGEFVDCPLHFARFEIKTGKAVCAPADGDLDSYKVRITGDDIELLIP